MMEVIEDLPGDIVGIAARGKITKHDYETVLIPAVEKAIQEHGTISMLYAIEGFDGMDMAAMWDDAAFGIKHWNDFTHFALVTDVDWIKNMTAFFAWMLPAEVRVFPVAEVEKARAWLVTAKDKKAA